MTAFTQELSLTTTLCDPGEPLSFPATGSRRSSAREKRSPATQGNAPGQGVAPWRLGVRILTENPIGSRAANPVNG